MKIIAPGYPREGDAKALAAVAQLRDDIENGVVGGGAGSTAPSNTLEPTDPNTGAKIYLEATESSDMGVVVKRKDDGVDGPNGGALSFAAEIGYIYADTGLDGNGDYSAGITFNKSTVILTAAPSTAVPESIIDLNATHVRVNGTDIGGGSSNVIVDEVIGANASSYDITGLDLDVDGRYTLEVSAPYVSSSIAVLRVNSDTTDNYGVRYMVSEGTTPSGSTKNAIPVNDGNGASYARITITKAGAYGFMGDYTLAVANGKIEHGSFAAGNAYSGGTNVTSLHFHTEQTNAVTAGMRIKLTKG